ncbi:DUF6350 family protein [Streptomyces sp. NPDC003077]|uniref:cell division protein PerM n=1 Tax=Streptomyces sp. NPDC003077 TaxID=3154443 RepID=UPI0033BDFD0A
MAAGLGLGSIAVVVLLLWIASPYPDHGSPQALRLAADLWFLAHGADLVRTGSGPPAPVAVTPLLLTALPVWLLYRAARHVLLRSARYGDRPDRSQPDGLLGGRPGGLPGDQRGGLPGDQRGGLPGDQRGGLLDDPDVPPTDGALLRAVLAGYLLVAMAALLYASATGPLRVAPLGALVCVPFVAGCVLAVAAWRALGRSAFTPLPAPLEHLREGLPAGVRRLLERHRLTAALRAAAAASAALALSGALFGLVSLGRHAGEVWHQFLHLAPDWPGRCSVVLVTLALLPNVAVWGAAYGLGPGFTVGAGSVAGPLGVAGYPSLPPFPLLGLLPDEGVGGALSWATAVAPAAAGVALSWYAALPARAAYGRGKPGDGPGPGTGSGPGIGAGIGSRPSSLSGPDAVQVVVDGSAHPSAGVSAHAKTGAPGGSGSEGTIPPAAHAPDETPANAPAPDAPHTAPAHLPDGGRTSDDAPDTSSTWNPSVPPRWDWRATASVAALGAGCCGVAMTMLAGLAGGAMGNAALADFGPDPWLTGLAAAGWTALLGIPGALILHFWWRHTGRSARHAKAPATPGRRRRPDRTRPRRGGKARLRPVRRQRQAPRTRPARESGPASRTEPAPPRHRQPPAAARPTRRRRSAPAAGPARHRQPRTRTVPWRRSPDPSAGRDPSTGRDSSTGRRAGRSRGLFRTRTRSRRATAPPDADVAPDAYEAAPPDAHPTA